MVNPFRAFADQLVDIGYATDTKPVIYGLTKQVTYEIFVEDSGWQSVNPFGYEEHSPAQNYALKSRNILCVLLTYLDEDQLLHFRKIHKPINEMRGEQLTNAISLVERTLVGNGLNPTSIVEDLRDSILIDKRFMVC